MKKNIDLFELEKKQDIWSFRDENNIPLYLMVRFQILQGFINEKFEFS